MQAPRLANFSLSGYVNALFTAPVGYYRVIVFVVTATPFNQVEARVTGEIAEHWLTGGLNELPESIAQQAYNEKVDCTALIYEFQRHGGIPNILRPGRLDGLTHLRQSGLMAGFTRRHLDAEPVLILLTIAIQPFVARDADAALGLMRTSQLWLGPFQGLVASALGVLVVSKKDAPPTK